MLRSKGHTVMGSTVKMKFNIRKNVSGYLLFLLMHINEKSWTEVVETTNTVPECNAATGQRLGHMA